MKKSQKKRILKIEKYDPFLQLRSKNISIKTQRQAKKAKSTKNDQKGYVYAPFCQKNFEVEKSII